MASTELNEAQPVKSVAGASRPPEPEKIECPRCESTDTKFCYYNNYNLSQPRHYCKSCRRYWTRGGTIRNVPVGGSSRKRPRSHSLPPTPATASSSSYFNIEDGALPVSFTALLCAEQEGEDTLRMERGGLMDGGDWFGLV